MGEVTARAEEIRRGGHVATPYSCDLSDPDRVTELFAQIRDNHGQRVDACVHMAGGFALSGSVADATLEVWDRQLTINLRTALLVSRAVIPLLRLSAGSLVFFSSEVALPGAKLAHISAYAVAKIGVAALATAISQEESASGVRANCVAPGTIRTATNVADMGPGGRFVEREEVAATVSYLCSDASRAVTGQVLHLTPR
jgi:NAD(P)-dependent dehydrogenase (short-subunit alcohol dehydrogenase family)